MGIADTPPPEQQGTKESSFAEAATCLTAIEPVVASVGEEFDARTGWRELNSTLHRLAMALLCAAGEPDQPPEANAPDWYSDPS